MMLVSHGVACRSRAASVVRRREQRRDAVASFAPPPPPRTRADGARRTAPASSPSRALIYHVALLALQTRRRGGSWTVDYPEADNHFITGMREWAGTNLKSRRGPKRSSSSDERLFDYPFIYFVEPGFMELSTRRRRGCASTSCAAASSSSTTSGASTSGRTCRTQMKKVLPEYEIKELPLTHPILHSYLDIEEVVQVPNIYNAQRGITSEKGGSTPYYMGIEDKNGRHGRLHLAQLRSRRRLGVDQRLALPRQVRPRRLQNRHQRRHLRDEPLKGKDEG